MQDKLIDIINENSFEQLQEKNTRENSLLDLTLATNPSLVRNLNNIPGIGDHEAIIIDSFVRPVFSIQKKKKCYNFKKADWPSLKSYCEKLSKSIITRSNLGYNIFQLWDLFKSSLNLGISQYVPSKFVKKRSSLPWVNKHLLKLIKKKTKLYKEAKTSGSWNNYKEHKKLCRKEMRKAKNDFVNKTIDFRTVAIIGGHSHIS